MKNHCTVLTAPLVYSVSQFWKCSPATFLKSLLASRKLSIQIDTSIFQICSSIDSVNIEMSFLLREMELYSVLPRETDMHVISSERNEYQFHLNASWKTAIQPPV